MAGETARAQAEKRLAEADRLIQSAERWQQGADGEVVTARGLDELAEAPGWTVINDVPWPGRPYANIDHVVVGPSGVFVIDSKNWSGLITVMSEELRQDGRLRIDAVQDVATAAQAVAFAVPGLDPDVVQPVVCLVRDEWIAERIGDVSICTSQNVVALLKTRRQLLEAAAVDAVAAELTAVFDAARHKPASVPTGPRPVEVSAAAAPAPPPTKRESRHRRTGRRRPPIAQAIAGLGLIAVVAFRPDVLEPVADFFSDIISPDQTDSTPDGPAGEKLGKGSNDKAPDQSEKDTKKDTEGNNP